jgi:hypothetical protein
LTEEWQISTEPRTSPTRFRLDGTAKKKLDRAVQSVLVVLEERATPESGVQGKTQLWIDEQVASTFVGKPSLLESQSALWGSREVSAHSRGGGRGEVFVENRRVKGQ